MENKEELQPDDIKPERRKFKRINRSYIVSYAIVKGEDLKFDVSQTRNLSEGGLLFMSDREFEKGAILKIKLRLPEFSDYVTVRTQVIESTQLVKDIMYDTRVKFIEVEQKVRESIRKLVDHE
ncbi:MAG: PilZ domain-containing protein [Candidatus Omnitrophota bacterium]|nr:PilZ domain-containing protein [Candidatus Omnitrophota bacterium]